MLRKEKPQAKKTRRTLDIFWITYDYCLLAALPLIVISKDGSKRENYCTHGLFKVSFIWSSHFSSFNSILTGFMGTCTTDPWWVLSPQSSYIPNSSHVALSLDLKATRSLLQSYPFCLSHSLWASSITTLSSDLNLAIFFLWKYSLNFHPKFVRCIFYQ